MSPITYEPTDKALALYRERPTVWQLTVPDWDGMPLAGLYATREAAEAAAVRITTSGRDLERSYGRIDVRRVAFDPYDAHHVNLARDANDERLLRVLDANPGEAS